MIELLNKYINIIFVSILFFFPIAINAKIANDKNFDTLEIYFDTQDFYLLDNNITLKYRATKYIVEQNIKYNEFLIYISKSNKKFIFKVKHYNKTKRIEDKHPLLFLVNRKEREKFFKILQNDGLRYPMKLRYIFKNFKSPHLKMNESTEYNTLFNKRKSVKYFFVFKFQYPTIFNFIYFMLIGILSFLLIKFLFLRLKYFNS